jgi:hypothetical protein
VKYEYTHELNERDDDLMIDFIIKPSYSSDEIQEANDACGTYASVFSNSVSHLNEID